MSVWGKAHRTKPKRGRGANGFVSITLRRLLLPAPARRSQKLPQPTLASPDRTRLTSIGGSGHNKPAQLPADQEGGGAMGQHTGWRHLRGLPCPARKASPLPYHRIHHASGQAQAHHPAPMTRCTTHPHPQEQKLLQARDWMCIPQPELPHLVVAGDCPESRRRSSVGG